MEIGEAELEEAFGGMKIPPHIRLFMITESMYVRIYKGKASWKLQSEEFEVVGSLKCERGDILDLFSKMEFLVNELIILEMLGAGSAEAYRMDDVLAQIDFFGRLRLLRKWGVLDGRLVESLNQAKQVRNGFAHSWGVEEVLYKEKPVEENFGAFKKDMKEAWGGLVEVYKEKQKKYDVRKIFGEIREYNR